MAKGESNAMQTMIIVKAYALRDNLLQLAAE